MRLDRLQAGEAASVSQTVYDTISYYPSYIVSTKNDLISGVQGEEYTDFQRNVQQYFGAQGVVAEDLAKEDIMQSVVSDDCSEMQITLKTEESYSAIWFAIWSAENGQDDLEWVQAVKTSGALPPICQSTVIRGFIVFTYIRERAIRTNSLLIRLKT